MFEIATFSGKVHRYHNPVLVYILTLLLIMIMLPIIAVSVLLVLLRDVRDRLVCRHD